MPDRRPLPDEAAAGVALLEPEEIAALCGSIDAPIETREATPPSAGTRAILRVELARARLPAETVDQWKAGSVATFDASLEGSVDVFVNERLAARGKLTVEQGRWCVRIVELVAPGARLT